MSTVETSTPIPDVVVPYVEAVRALLAAVPADERDEVIEDLIADLTEQAAEEGVELRASLGTPSAYAAEFVASAGYDVGDVADDLPRPSRSTELRERWSSSRLLEAMRRFWPEARPGWWALRPFLATAGLLALAADDQWIGEAGSLLVAALLGAALVPSSIALGRRALLGDDQRLERVASIVAVVGVLVAFQSVASFPRYRFVSASEAAAMAVPATLRQPDGSYISNIYAYGRDGQPVDVFLYDQNGQPIENVDSGPYAPALEPDFEFDANGVAVLNLFPRRHDVPGRIRAGASTRGGIVVVPDPGPATASTTTTTTTPTSPTTAPPPAVPAPPPAGLVTPAP